MHFAGRALCLVHGAQLGVVNVLTSFKREEVLMCEQYSEEFHCFVSRLVEMICRICLLERSSVMTSGKAIICVNLGG